MDSKKVFDMNEPDRDFRDRMFYGKDRALLMIGQGQRIELGDISEHDIEGRIRQGYLAELRGDYDTARQIYESVGFTDRLDNEGEFLFDEEEGPLLDEEVEHYTE